MTVMASLSLFALGIVLLWVGMESVLRRVPTIAICALFLAAQFAGFTLSLP